jgi:hypothetical protein
MKMFLTFFCLIGFALFAFCWWGMFTTTGTSTFPEMAGLLPFYAGGLGGAIIVLTGLIYAFRRWRRRPDAR